MSGPLQKISYVADTNQLAFVAQGRDSLPFTLYTPPTAKARVYSAYYSGTSPVVSGAKARVYNAQFLGTSTNTPTDRPTGPGYSRYEDLYQPGDTLTTTLARCNDGDIVTFPEGVFEFSDFVTGYQAGVTIPPKCKGIIGSGKGQLGSTSSGTIFRIVPYSSTQAGVIPAQGTSQPNQLNLFKHYPNYPVIYQNFQLCGTDQGHNFNGFQIYGAQDGSIVQDILITGWQGDNGAPPGETAGLSINGGSNHTFRRVEVDGRRDTNSGVVYGAMGMTFQNSVGSTFDTCVSHYTRVACYVFYQTFNSTLIDCVVDSTSAGSYAIGNGGINHERTAGTKLIRPRLIGRWHKVHITHSNDTWTLTRNGVTYTTKGGSLSVQDPIWNDAWGDNLLYIQTWTPYSLGTFGSGNSMTYPGATGTGNDGPDCSPAVYKANGTPITYVWAFDQNRHISRGPLS